jgi:hypothetical protein
MIVSVVGRETIRERDDAVAVVETRAAGRTVAAHGHGAMCSSSRLLLVVEAVSAVSATTQVNESPPGRHISALIGCEASEDYCSYPPRQHGNCKGGVGAIPRLIS